jgi:hypothetical protein
VRRRSVGGVPGASNGLQLRNAEPINVHCVRLSSRCRPSHARCPTM